MLRRCASRPRERPPPHADRRPTPPPERDEGGDAGQAGEKGARVRSPHLGWAALRSKLCSLLTWGSFLCTLGMAVAAGPTAAATMSSSEGHFLRRRQQQQQQQHPQRQTLKILQPSSTGKPFPDIGLDLLQKLGLAGSFSSFSSAVDLQPFAISLSANDASGSLAVYRRTNSSMDLLGALTGVSVNSICSMKTKSATDGSETVKLYLGGQFEAVVNGDGLSIRLGNVVAFDPESGSFSPMGGGLDGPVRSLYCDQVTETLYVGGAFAAPVQPSVNSAVAASAFDVGVAANANNAFGGRVAKWKSGKWMPVGFKGLDGPVNSIVPSDDKRSILFGGLFRGTRDGPELIPPATRRLNLNIARVTSDNSDPDPRFGNPNNVLCQTTGLSAAGNVWLSRPGEVTTLRIDYPFLFVPSVVRLKNPAFEGRGTKSFRVRTLPSHEVLQFNYTTVMGTPAQCSTLCLLGETSDEHGNPRFQDFVVAEPETSVQGLLVDLLESLGSSTGLGGVEVYQKDIVTYAFQEYNMPGCPGEHYQANVSAHANGNWTARLGGRRERTILTHVPTDENDGNAASVTFFPNLPESGKYSVWATIPKCNESGDNNEDGHYISCEDMGSVDYDIRLGGSTTVRVTISQKDTGIVHIYTGLFNIENTTTPPAVTLTMSSASADLARADVIVADSIVFVKQSSADELNSMLEYRLSDESAGGIPSWGGLIEQLPANAEVTSLASYPPFRLFIGGSFAGPGYQNIVGYDHQTLTPLDGGGLNGRVADMVGGQNGLYVGGAFSADAAGNITLRHLARFDVFSGHWASMADGVNGPVTMLASDGDGRHIIVSGNFTELAPYSAPLLTTPGLASVADGFPGSGSAGFAVFSTRRNAWSWAAPYIDGRLDGFASATLGSGRTFDFFAGPIKQAFYLKSSGVGYLDGDGFPATWNFNGLDPPFSPLIASSNTSSAVNTAFFLDAIPGGDPRKTVEDGSVILVGGRFQTRSGTKNVALWNGTEWIPFGDPFHLRNRNVVNGEVNSILYTSLKSLIIGGDFLATVSADGQAQDSYPALVVWYYHITPAHQPVINPLPESQPARLSPVPGSIAPVVNVIKQVPGQDLIIAVAGSFLVAAAEGRRCINLCFLSIVTKEWIAIGPGFTGGPIEDIAFNDDRIIVCGHFTSPTRYVGEIDLDDGSATKFPTDDSGLPGPASRIAANPAEPTNFYVAGVNGYVYLYDGSRFVALGNMTPGARMRHLRVVGVFPPGSRPPTSSASSYRGPDFADHAVLVAGSDLCWTASADAAAANFSGSSRCPAAGLLHGKDWFPLVYVPQGSDVRMIFGTGDFGLFPANAIPLYLVVLVAVGIALASVLAVVAGGFAYAFARRRNERQKLEEATAKNDLAWKSHTPEISKKATWDPPASRAVQPLEPPCLAKPPSAHQQKHLDREPGETHEMNELSPFPSPEQDAKAPVSEAESPARDSRLSTRKGRSTPKVYYAKYRFQPVESGELELEAGDKVIVTDDSDDIWYMGWVDRGARETPTVGVFPSTYIQPEPPNTQPPSPARSSTSTPLPSDAQTSPVA